MGYATLDDLAQYMPEGTLAGVSIDRQQYAINAASAQADAALGNQYDLPLTPPYPPDVIANVSMLAAAMLMAGSVGYSSENGGNAWVGEYRKNAMAYFDDVATGKRTPAGIVDTTPHVRAGGPLVTSNPRRGW